METIPKKCKACLGTGFTPLTADPFNSVIQHVAKCPECRGTGIIKEKDNFDKMPLEWKERNIPIATIKKRKK